MRAPIKHQFTVLSRSFALEGGGLLPQIQRDVFISRRLSGCEAIESVRGVFLAS